jgi:hypothetical protein
LASAAHSPARSLSPGIINSLQIRASSSAIRPAAAVQSTPCGVMLSSAMKQAIPFSKIDEITIHNLELQILGEVLRNSDKYR